MSETQIIVDKILKTNKITKEDLDKKVSEKLASLGGLISEDGALHIIANELGVKMTTTPASSEMKLKDVLAGMKNVTVLAKVVKKYELRTFGEDKSGKVANVLIGDETKNTRLTFWNEKTDYFEKLNEGDIVEVQSAYSKENKQGYIEIHMGNNSHCIINPEGKTVETIQRSENQQETPKKKLNEITKDDSFVSITATIVQAYDPRFFEVCPNCNKRMKQELDKFTCAEHGEQEPAYNYVMNLFLDDGTDNMRAALWKEQIQQLLELSNEEIIKIKSDTQAIENIKTDLLGRIITARARVKHNETYNNNELVLYNINKHPQPEIETTTNTQETTKTKKPVVEEAPAKVTEEMMEDGEDLISIDDIDGDI